LIVVDSSVWIAASRQRLLAETLSQLLEQDEVALALPVRLELLAGTAKHERAKVRSMLGALPQLHPTDDTWAVLYGWIDKAADAGHRFGVADLLISSMANEIGGLVWSLDKDFERMEQLGFINLYTLPH